MVVQLTPATRLLQGSLHIVAQWQLTSFVLEMTGLDIQSGCHRSTSPNVRDRGRAWDECVIPIESSLVWRSKNVTMECITAWRQVVKIWPWKEKHIINAQSPSSVPWQKMLTSSSKPDSLHSIRQYVWHGHIRPFNGVVAAALTLAPSQTNAIDGALLAWYFP